MSKSLTKITCSYSIICLHFSSNDEASYFYLFLFWNISVCEKKVVDALRLQFPESKVKEIIRLTLELDTEEDSLSEDLSDFMDVTSRAAIFESEEVFDESVSA